MNVHESFDRLRAYCEAEDFAGWDPYDGLKSKVAHALLPLKHSAILRLCIIQGFKRCPINLRRLAMVPKEHNAKGIGLFLQGYVNLYKIVKSQKTKVEGLGSEEDILQKIMYLADMLLEMRSDKMFPGEYHGACWGYNFDWQARRLFLFPAYTPTVVATNFCATALLEAYEVLKDSLRSKDEGQKLSEKIEKYKDVALSAAEFVIKDLHRCEVKSLKSKVERQGAGAVKDASTTLSMTSDEVKPFLFSYSKLPGNDTVYNASLLGSRLLAYCYKYTGREEYKTLAEASVKACCQGQSEDGSWVYGLLPVQSWIDSFHTGYNLDGLIAYEEQTGDTKYHAYIEKGLEFYLKNHFTEDGEPKYYHDRQYPIDIHCPGQLFVTLSRLHKFEEYRPLAEKVLEWTVKNMQDKKGYFYYQLKPGMSSKIPYMRWSNAFMFCALSYFLMEEAKV